MSVRILHGDCRELMLALPDCSVDSIVTDPPYHLTTGKKGGCGQASVNLETPYGRARIGTGFMGMKWDGGNVAFDPATWAQALRVLKPGGMVVAFGGTRTYHRLACAIEDAGFEIRDMLAWLYGNGFPKGTDKAKIPKAWRGWNTALKPAVEPICLARKPMQGTLAENLLRWGTGAMFVDGCRIALDGETITVTGKGAVPARHDVDVARDAAPIAERAEGLGRWPANVLHDGSDEVLEVFPSAPGQKSDLHPVEHAAVRTTYNPIARIEAERSARGDVGSAARFFYCPKATRTDRNDGLQGLPEKPLLWSSGEQSPGTFQSPNTKRAAQNNHPTVKPTDTMRWLCRLVTPPGGTLLDPFMGSGSTLKAAELEGFDAIGMELEADYIEIARRRIASDTPLFAEVA